MTDVLPHLLCACWFSAFSDLNGRALHSLRWKVQHASTGATDCTEAGPALGNTMLGPSAASSKGVAYLAVIDVHCRGNSRMRSQTLLTHVCGNWTSSSGPPTEDFKMQMSATLLFVHDINWPCGETYESNGVRGLTSVEATCVKYHNRRRRI